MRKRGGMKKGKAVALGGAVGLALRKTKGKKGGLAGHMKKRGGMKFSVPLPVHRIKKRGGKKCSCH